METTAEKCRRLNLRTCFDCGKKLKPDELMTCQECFEKQLMDAEKN
jgi:hypothetical protein